MIFCSFVFAHFPGVVQVVEKEALALKKEYGTPRLTAIEGDNDGEINDADVIANTETLVVSSARF
jgi:DNA gyrase subunit A